MQGRSYALLNVGIDVGSTTTKLVALDAASGTCVFSQYIRHYACQSESVLALLAQLESAFPGAVIRAAFCGSGGLSLATFFAVPYVQEVVASALALQINKVHAHTAIELGGQDAKMIFFAADADEHLSVSDMRMNGACAGGTGAFIDEIATLLNVPVESFNDLALQGTHVYEISGRCGVFAKTDIQPLLNQGARKEDIALSTYHAIAKQTIGGLAQGLDIQAPVAFLGGPLTFNPRLVQVFAERLELTEGDCIIPEHPETAVALGAALALEGLFADKAATLELAEVQQRLAEHIDKSPDEAIGTSAFFADEEEFQQFSLRHTLPRRCTPELTSATRVEAYLGIDSGSTTTKFALIDEQGSLLESFYASNEGEPLDIATEALVALRDRYKQAGAVLDIRGVGTTGYGELLFAKAFDADYHVVETVAHAHAAQVSVPDVSFLLDIGGQDMKAIWLNDGVVNDIVVNEACSSGCGSFLESFANSLGIPVEGIAEAAFESSDPALLGSRCTVFMNSSIVTEQKNGKSPEDIMAGVCRSIIENVFTKVIRVSNLESLGNRIVVQGGTFKNDAVLRAFEQYVGKEVIRAPYPEIMGAIGVALLTRDHLQSRDRQRTPSRFIGLECLDDFSYTQESNAVCPFCSNHCARSVITFSNGRTWVTGNRCERGEVTGDPKDEQVRENIKALSASLASVPDMFKIREQLLLQEYPCEQLLPTQQQRIGLPRVLANWETLPFWRTFFSSLGFTVVLSDISSRALYEQGLSAVSSDTVCFPAKLVHGHLRNLASQGVDRIFMPAITTVKSENQEKTSESMCAVVKGYPLVIRNSDNPEDRWDIPFDDPLFHWYSDIDRERQLTHFMEETFDIAPESTRAAIAQGDSAQQTFKYELVQQGKAVIEQVERAGTYAIVLASRPYQNDTLVSHDISSIFTGLGIPVLTVDSLPGLHEIDLSKSRIDIANNYHARMLASSLYVSRNPHLHYAQLVSFGCGHDAYLTDEIIRLMREVSGEAPLVLKVDESDAQGPLRIRIRSFVETLAIKHKRRLKSEIRELQDPYPVKYAPSDKQERVVLVPNTSHAFSKLMSAAFCKQGMRAEPLEVGREEAIRLGKKYVHNDICFPAQIVIGEALAALESGKYDLDRTAIGMAKYVGDCRLTHYTALLRKALDDAGYAQVPLITNDDVDSHDIHPGFKMSILSALRIASALPMIDILEELLRKMRPYELEPGASDAAFERAVDCVVTGLEAQGSRGAQKGFKQAIDIMKGVGYDRSEPRPTVLIVGEFLLNFHPGANNDIELYLERNGLEVIEARMTDVIRKTYFYKDSQIKEYGIDKPPKEKAWYALANRFFDFGHAMADKIALAHPLYEPATRMPQLVQASDALVHHTFDTGEGVLIPGEILHHASRGCKAFVILQPFGCLPNHIVGRGITRKLKELHPDVQILSLDYDPDVSVANIENRLQMLIANARYSLFEHAEGIRHDDTKQPYSDDHGSGGDGLGSSIDWDELTPDMSEEELVMVAMRQHDDTSSEGLRETLAAYKKSAAAHLSDASAHAAQTAKTIAKDASAQVAGAARHVAGVSAHASAQVAGAAKHLSEVSATATAQVSDVAKHLSEASAHASSQVVSAAKSLSGAAAEVIDATKRSGSSRVGQG